ncbi:hypothetical protein [Cardinium endosymbiont of Nabis limbatus]|uniref:hypothetical protein n=1 Tax=Cardinium endosymbiont of Nabis limbatus TaxID=3066217 RepID=UPI003AF3580A
MVCIIQLMQCTMLRPGLYGNGLVKCAHGLRGVEEVGQEKQESVNILCIEFYSLFKEGRLGLEPYFPKGQVKYSSNDYFTIFPDERVTRVYKRIVLKPQGTLDTECIDRELLAEIKRDRLYDPEGFKELITDCLQKNYKVVIFASIAYPDCIPIVLEETGLSQEQLSNICIVCNGEDENLGAAQDYKYIQYAEWLCNLKKGQEGNGLVVSSSWRGPLTHSDFAIDYKLWTVVLESESSKHAAAASYWRVIRASEAERYSQMQKAKENRQALKKVE